MEESKTLVEQLRKMVELSIASNLDPIVYADVIIGHLCVSMSDARELFTAIADRIEREYIPLPRFEDGEPVKVGDLVLWNDGGAKRVEDIKVDVHLEGSCGTYNSVLRRPELDSLERIEEDARKKVGNYWGCNVANCYDCPAKVDGKKPYERYGTSNCVRAMYLDLLRRQRELLERGQE